MLKNKYIWLSIAIVTPVLAVADTNTAAPTKKMNIQDLFKATTGYSQQSATVAGVRGLEDTGAEIDTKARDYAALEKIDQVVIHDSELKKFLDAGGLK